MPLILGEIEQSAERRGAGAQGVAEIDHQGDVMCWGKTTKHACGDLRSRPVEIGAGNLQCGGFGRAGRGNRNWRNEPWPRRNLLPRASSRRRSLAVAQQRSGPDAFVCSRCLLVNVERAVSAVGERMARNRQCGPAIRRAIRVTISIWNAGVRGKLSRGVVGVRI